MPPLPKSRADIDLRDLCPDNLLHQEEDILIFSTKNNLELLSEADIIFMDGTFSVAPRLFKQLYTLHVLFKDFYLPVCYALLPSKSGDIYYRFFEIVKFKMSRIDLILNPQTILVDFEAAMLTSVRQHFPATNVKGCFFHFTQAIWRNTQSIGLVSIYNDNSTVRRIVRSLMALAMLPKNWVRHQYRQILEMPDADHPLVQNLFRYFESTWLDGRFPIAMWNVFDSSVKTNNCVEGWHSTFRICVGKCHPNIYELVTAINTEQNMTEKKVRAAREGEKPPPQKKIYRKRAEEMTLLKNRFNSGGLSLKEYFDAIRKHIGYRRI